VVANRTSQAGFVLVSSIWFVLVMLVLSGLFGFYASEQMSKAKRSKLRIDDQINRLATEQTLLYVLATSASNRAGLKVNGRDGSEVKLDGTHYQSFGSVYFAIGDKQGLIGLNTNPNYHLGRLINAFESDGLRREALLHALYDYIDINDRAHLNGREAPAYRVAGLPLPTNDHLKSPAELHRVYGWSDWLREHPDFKASDWLGAGWGSRLNVNTMPEDLIPLVLPVTSVEAKAIVGQRRVKPFRGYSDFSLFLNNRVSLADNYYGFIPSDHFRIRIFSAKNHKMSTISVLFKPLSTSSPWEIDHRYQNERDFDIAEPARVVAAEYFSRELSSSEDGR
jgi:hypothetical protein